MRVMVLRSSIDRRWHVSICLLLALRYAHHEIDFNCQEHRPRLCEEGNLADAYRLLQNADEVLTLIACRSIQ